MNDEQRRCYINHAGVSSFWRPTGATGRECLICQSVEHCCSLTPQEMYDALMAHNARRASRAVA